MVQFCVPVANEGIYSHICKFKKSNRFENMAVFRDKINVLFFCCIDYQFIRYQLEKVTRNGVLAYRIVCVMVDSI